MSPKAWFFSNTLNSLKEQKHLELNTKVHRLIPTTKALRFNKDKIFSILNHFIYISKLHFYLLHLHTEHHNEYVIFRVFKAHTHTMLCVM